MSDAIIVALLSLAGTLGGSLLGIRQSNRLVNYRIDRLEEKVTKHNNLVERMAVIEKRVDTHGKEIDGLRGEVHELEISG